MEAWLWKKFPRTMAWLYAENYRTWIGHFVVGSLMGPYGFWFYFNREWGQSYDHHRWLLDHILDLVCGWAGSAVGTYGYLRLLRIL